VGTFLNPARAGLMQLIAPADEQVSANSIAALLASLTWAITVAALVIAQQFPVGPARMVAVSDRGGADAHGQRSRVWFRNFGTRP
jgi:hypothetical protein